MSRDIRSFFAQMSKKSEENASSKHKTAKTAVVIDSDDDDIVKSTPDTKVLKSKATVTRKKVHVISSDSEEEAEKKKVSKNKKTDEELKPVSIDDIFGDKPIKQSKVEYVPKPKKDDDTPTKSTEKQKKKSKKKPKTELGVHSDPDFEKTLLDLDDDLLMENVDVLDRTIEEALHESHLRDSKKAENNQSDPKDKSPKRKKKNSKSEDTNVVDLTDSSEPKQSSSKENSPHKKGEKKRSGESSKGPTPKKPKLEHSDSGIDPDQEAFEKKRYSHMLYQKYLQRGGPKHHGQKEIPKGKPGCLKNLTFLRTGVLDSLESNEFEDLVKEHGGRVVHAVSKKVNYLVVGEDPGPSKLSKAEDYGIAQINEDELLNMILVKSGMKPKFPEHKSDASVESGIDVEDQPSKGKKRKSSTDDEMDKKRSEKERKAEKSPSKNKESKSEKSHKSKGDKATMNFKALSEKSKTKEVKLEKDEKGDSTSKKDSSTDAKHQKIDERPRKSENEKVKKEDDLEKVEVVPVKKTPKQESLRKESPTGTVQERCTVDLSWTEKYKPTDITGIIGQQGDQSNMNKLMKWLKNWNGNRTKDVKRPSPWAKNDDGAYFKAALLSGSPGVGKTTTATLVCTALGYDIVEFNASDTRSKKLLHEEVSQLLQNTSISSFAAGKNTTNKKRVLLMDEVDGMAGNEDRGGIQELMNLIKTSNFPIICMCNDRNHAKLRSFVNYCYELKFSKPKAEQITGAMMSICFKEGIKMSRNALIEIIIGTGCDIRQTLNHLAMWSVADKNVSMEIAQKEAQGSKKDTVLGPWEVIRKVFTKKEQESMSLADKSRLFFFDYSIGPLFVQENYLSVEPECKDNEKCKRAAQAADAISIGDLIDSKIRGTNNWSLLESQAIFSSVLPGHYMAGHFTDRINFPGWLGKNSSANKHKRILSELYMHTRMSSSGNRLAMNLDYLVPLRNAIINPLKKYGVDGVQQAIDIMKAYSLLREDLDNLMELTQWKGTENPFNKIDAKVKSAFTRAYNKQASALPFAPGTAVSKKRAAAIDAEGILDEEDLAALADEDDNEDEDATADAFIKVKAKDTKSKAQTNKAGTSKGKEPTTSKKKGRSAKK